MKRYGGLTVSALGSKDYVTYKRNIKNTQIASETDFMFYRKDREEQKGGGVLLLVKTSIKSDRRLELECKEKEHNKIICVEIEPSPETKFVTVVAYR